MAKYEILYDHFVQTLKKLGNFVEHVSILCDLLQRSPTVVDQDWEKKRSSCMRIRFREGLS